MVKVTSNVITGKTLRVRVSKQIVTITTTSQATEQYTPSRGTDGKDTNWRSRRGTSMPNVKSRQGILERLSLTTDQDVSLLSTILLAASTTSQALCVS
ncbi:MAG: hypothetical protein ABSD49_12485 [Candidatus Bathyarchaeia archaeon]